MELTQSIVLISRKLVLLGHNFTHDGLIGRETASSNILVVG